MRFLLRSHKELWEMRLYGEVWDKTAEEHVSNPSSGDESDIFEDCEFKKEIAPIFLVLVTNLSHVNTGHK